MWSAKSKYPHKRTGVTVPKATRCDGKDGCTVASWGMRGEKTDWSCHRGRVGDASTSKVKRQWRGGKRNVGLNENQGRRE